MDYLKLCNPIFFWFMGLCWEMCELTICLSSLVNLKTYVIVKFFFKFYLPSVMYNSNSFILTSLLQIQKSILDHAILFSSDPQDTTETPFHNAPWLLHKDRHKGEFVTNKPLSDHLFSCCFWKYHTNDTQKHYQKMYSAMNNLFLS